MNTPTQIDEPNVQKILDGVRPLLIDGELVVAQRAVSATSRAR